MPRKSDTLSVSDRVSAVCGSINFKDYSSMDKETLCNKMFDIVDNWQAIRDYYFIFHDETDTYHLHYLFIFKGQQYVSNLINRFRDGFGVEVEAINYKKLLHRNAHLRYLLHIDSESKRQKKKEYVLQEIYTNVNTQLLKCFLDSKDDNNKMDMRTLEGVCVQCGGNELKIAEFLDELYDRNYRRIRLILDNYASVRLQFDEELPF